MKTKKIELIASPPKPHFVGDGFRVHNFIPGGFRMDMERMNPFILLDYNSKFTFPPSEKPKGVGVHPHRGFETVTIAYNGRISHHDSSGGGGVIGEGDVQWMTAASGVLHKEYHEEDFSRKGGDFQMVQLWINLPAKYKMSKPKYQAISKSEMAIYSLDNDAGFIEVIAGNYKDAKGPASTFTPLHMFNAHLNSNGKANFSFPSHFNTGALVIKGSVKVNEEEVAQTDQFILFENEGESFNIEAMEKSVVLIISGKPIDEPIVAQGPFVMNTRGEIKEAIQDFNNGKFGYLND